MSLKPDRNIELTWTVDAMMTQAKSIYIIFDDQRKQIVFFFRRGIFLKKYKTCPPHVYQVKDKLWKLWRIKKGCVMFLW